MYSAWLIRAPNNNLIYSAKNNICGDLPGMQNRCFCCLIMLCFYILLAVLINIFILTNCSLKNEISSLNSVFGGSVTVFRFIATLSLIKPIPSSAAAGSSFQKETQCALFVHPWTAENVCFSLGELLAAKEVDISLRSCWWANQKYKKNKYWA